MTEQQRPTEEEMRAFKAKRGKVPVTYSGLLDFGDMIIAAIAKRVNPLADRVEALKKSVADLEATVGALQKAEEKTLADAFRGTWQPGIFYTRGGLVVWDGSLWLTMADTGEKPGSSEAWRMITKRGKDAKS